MSEVTQILGAIERGEHEPKFFTLWRLKTALKINLGRLGREIEREYHPPADHPNQGKTPGK